MKASEAKALLEPIPAENFITEIFGDGESKCCAIGHLVRLSSNDPNNFSGFYCSDKLGLSSNPNEKVVSEINEFRRLTREFMKEQHSITVDISDINNEADYNGYTEPRIKDRVVHLLDDMIKAGY